MCGLLAFVSGLFFWSAIRRDDPVLAHGHRAAHGRNAKPVIPFVFHGSRHSLPDVDKIPLADIIAINLDHYRLSADYKHGMHFTALPTAWVSGFDKNASLILVAY